MSRIWLLALVPPIRGGRWWCGIAIGVVLLAMFAAAGNFAPDPSPDANPGVILFFTVILAYIVPVVHFITERAQRALDELATLMKLDARRLEVERLNLTHRPLRWRLQCLAAGLAAAFAHSTLLALTGSLELTDLDLLGLSGIAGTVLVWLVMTFAITVLVETARQFNRLAHEIDLDLLNTAALTPFGRVAVSSTLAIIGAQAAFPIMWLDEVTNAAAMVPGLIATAVPMVAIFALPVWPIHRRIITAKRDELARVNRWLAETRGDALPSDAGELTRLAPLLGYRNAIEHVHEWPFNAGLLTRLGFYLVIPPLTWVGAALIEILLTDVV